MTSILQISLALTFAPTLYAQSQGGGLEVAAPAASSAQPQRVEVVGDRNNEGANSPAIAQVVTQAELGRFADANVLDVLRRQPGIVVLAGPGGTGQVRMRGLAGGYVRILVDGAPAPAGFNLDGLAPSLVERIEIMPVASVEQGAQAIAGTINIVLKRTSSKLQRQANFVLHRGYGYWTPQVSATYGDGTTALAWLITGSARQRKGDESYKTVTEAYDGDANLIRFRTLDQFNHDDAQNWALSPRITWTLPSGASGQWQTFVSGNEYDSSGSDLERYLVGPTSSWGNDRYTSTGKSHTIRNSFQWRLPLSPETTAELKAIHNLAVSRQASWIQYFDSQQQLLHDQETSRATRTTTLNLAATVRTTLSSDHELALGAEVRRDRQRDARSDKVDGDSTLDDLGDRFDANLWTIAAFVRDEWKISKNWAVDLGLRWEQIGHSASGATQGENRFQRSIATPVVQTIIRLPTDNKDELRFALSRSWRVLDIAQLSGATSLSRDNSLSRPDVAGNPSLRPEQASGLDVSYSRSLPQSGSLTLTAFSRTLRDTVIVARSLEGDRWVERPYNAGHAQTQGLEANAKFNLPPMPKGMQIRLGMGRYWSKVEEIPGPNNRLSSQVPWSINLGLDHKLSTLPLSWGGSFGYVRNGIAQVSENQQSFRSHQRSLDVYGLWNLTGQMLLRIAASNLLTDEQRGAVYYTSPTYSEFKNTVSPSHVAARLSLEMKF